VKSFVVISFLLSLTFLLYAQYYDELIELDTPALVDSAWNNYYQELLELEKPLNISSRIYLQDTNNYCLNSLQYEIPQGILLLNNRYNIDTGNNDWGLHLNLKTERVNLVLGSYRVRFGRGLVCGTGSRKLPDSPFKLYMPTSPSTYTPLGAAFIYQGNSLQTLVFASVQNRVARLKDERITSLPTTNSDNLSHTQENIYGTSVAWVNNSFQIAGLLYRQQYDRAFNDSLLVSNLNAYSLYAALKLPNNQISTELSYANHQLSTILSWNYHLKSFSQTLSYAQNTIYHQFPYALSASILNHNTDRKEINCDLKWNVLTNANLQIHYGINIGPAFSGEPFSRFISSLAYDKRGTRWKLNFYQYDRELITWIDSTYISTIPEHYRIQTTGHLPITTYLFQQFEFSYTLQNKEDYTKNTYHFQYFLGYKKSIWEMRLGYTSWQSPHNFYIADEISPEYYSMCSSEETSISITTGLKFKEATFSLYGEKSLLSSKKYRIRIQLKVSIF